MNLRPALLAALLLPLSARAAEVSARVPQLALRYLAARDAFCGALDRIAALPAEQRNFANTPQALLMASHDFGKEADQLAAAAQNGVGTQNVGELIQADAQAAVSKMLARQELREALEDYAARNASGLDESQESLLRAASSALQARQALPESGAGALQDSEFLLRRLAARPAAWDKGQVDLPGLEDFRNQAADFERLAVRLNDSPQVEGFARTILWSHLNAARMTLEGLPQALPELPEEKRALKFLSSYPDERHQSFEGWRWSEEALLNSARGRVRRALEQAGKLSARLERDKGAIHKKGLRLVLSASFPFLSVQRPTLGQSLVEAAGELAAAARQLRSLGGSIEEKGLTLERLLVVKDLMGPVWTTPWEPPPWPPKPAIDAGLEDYGKITPAREAKLADELERLPQWEISGLSLVRRDRIAAVLLRAGWLDPVRRARLLVRLDTDNARDAVLQLADFGEVRGYIAADQTLRRRYLDHALKRVRQGMEETSQAYVEGEAANERSQERRYDFVEGRSPATFISRHSWELRGGTRRLVAPYNLSFAVVRALDEASPWERGRFAEQLMSILVESYDHMNYINARRDPQADGLIVLDHLLEALVGDHPSADYVGQVASILKRALSLPEQSPAMSARLLEAVGALKAAVYAKHDPGSALELVSSALLTRADIRAQRLGLTLR
ncbi:MAG: hypothetical protein KGO96_11065 [Elusimicrobia bacterium]|nr:hypothetical protein [Elusimicrobiota bacterium]MDE2426432.1 hypothetical protein [Elusimicrobiota bacterium]